MAILRSNKSTRQYTQTIIWTCVFGTAFAAVIAWMCIVQDRSEVVTNILVAVFGALTGWALAMFYSPYNDKDASRFAQIGQTVSAFFTGYVVSKMDRFFELSLFVKTTDGGGQVVETLTTGLNWFRVGIFSCSMLLGFLTIFSNRVYSGNDTSKLRTDQTGLSRAGR